MELDAPAEPLQLDALAASSAPSIQKEAGGGSAKDPERFYCPYPGCNRSFAELWRLKVHFRAPPDIRGSGKERGHGTELTHCPKCGKTLKPGKHHVGCSGSKANARQASKRSRPAGDSDAPDEALTSSPQPKHAKSGELDAEPLANAWQEFARSQGAHTMASMALQPMKQEHQEWAPALQHGILYGHNGAAACWLPGHVNGFVPQLQTQGFTQPQFPSELQFAGGAHGYPQQVAPFPSLPAYPQAGMTIPEQGQVLSLPPGGSIQHLAPPAGMPGVPGSVVYHQQPHEAPLLPPVPTATSVQHPPATGHSTQDPHQPSSQLPNGTFPHGEHQLEGRSGNCLGPGGSGGSGVSGSGGGGAGGDGSAPPSAPADTGGGLLPPLPPPPKPANSNDSDGLGSVFGDVEEFTRDFGRIPSPPPLPADFHSASTGTSAGVLFNFAQFGQKLPRSQSQTRLDRNLYGLGLDPGIDGDLLYDHSDDGDLMQLLFGVPDELPTMATIHLHKWNNAEEDGDDGGQGHPPSPPPLPPSARAGSGPAPSAATAADGGGTGGAGASGQHSSAAAAERSGGQASASAGGAQQQPQPSPHGAHAPGLNGKLEALGGSDAPVPDGFLGHGGSGGGKTPLGQLVNGMSNTHHGADEHHRDHLLDAETFRLLHSCD